MATAEERAERVRLFKLGATRDVNLLIKASLIKELREGSIVSVRELKDSINGGVGSILATIIERETGEKINCAGCQNEIGKLNMMSISEIEAQINELANTIVDRAKKKSRKWWVIWGSTIAPGIAKQRVKDWIREAIKTAGS